MCGLSYDQFSVFLHCVLLYLHLIPCPECVGDISRRKLDSTTVRLAAFTIYRHGLNQDIMAYIVGMSKATALRVFICWVILFILLFNELDLKPASGYTSKKVPKIFVETSHGLTDLITDKADLKFQYVTNFELSSLMFPNYQSTQNRKALV